MWYVERVGGDDRNDDDDLDETYIHQQIMSQTISHSGMFFVISMTSAVSARTGGGDGDRLKSTEGGPIVQDEDTVSVMDEVSFCALFHWVMSVCESPGL